MSFNYFEKLWNVIICYFVIEFFFIDCIIMLLVLVILLYKYYWLSDMNVNKNKVVVVKVSNWYGKIRLFDFVVFYNKDLYWNKNV